MSDFHTHTVTGLSRLLADKQASATELAQHFLARSQARADLGAYLSIDAEATLAQAKLPTCTDEEVQGYRWQKNRATGVEVGPRDLPVKHNDHGLDAMRYLFHTLTGAVRPQVYA